jgi:hypothetical protein
VGVQSEELNIQHVGYPGQWMPIGGMAGGEGPKEPLDGNSVLDVGICGYVDFIVQIDEFVVSHLPKGYESGGGEE